uniref:Kunitz-type serine protease inhibitor homolog beta-bungarotoxin B2 chain n=2 Tax=Bungarus multicinctus TaxID=8616 RepID=VKTH2_BUNMU|nr:RecName: Full=Kunitz-type serine protease inhibitor homolog beta-bungarotoxin B2 chain; AltName: Full=Beta-2-bungarotoxin; Flags: Precursor [Bungarus multicinctus]CAA72810.1 bungarotoxin, B2 chain [Bungarus multicinctus]CAJ18318.1 beta-bungarotoxin b2 chain precursor [Bungarus multicinctus]
MSSGGLLLLLGLLTLCAELTPVSSRKRHPDCDKPPDTKICQTVVRAFYYKPSAKRCVQFRYGGCNGNGNHFKSDHLCRCECLEYR